MRRMREPDEKRATVLLEEATHLLRSAPPGLYVALCAGNVPFVLGFLYFWADMSRGATAFLEAPNAALGMALLFIWMKGCQAYFASGLRDLLLGQERQGWGPRRWTRTLLAQAALQGTGLFILPVASIVAMPFGWTYAFYRNLSVFGNGQEPGLKPVIRKSWQQAVHDPSQNHLAIFILSVFALFVYINTMQALLLGPYMLKTLLGVDSIFVKSGASMFNTTLLAVAWGGSYLIMEPLINAYYTLRCFYGQSRSTGNDLMAELEAAAPKHITRPGAPVRHAAAVLTMAALMALCAGNAWAEPTNAPPHSVARQSSRPMIEKAARMDEAIETTLAGRKYQWRMPRLKEPEMDGREPGMIARFFQSVGKKLRSWGRALWRNIKRFFEWLSDIMPDLSSKRHGSRHGGGWGISPDLLVLILLFITAAVGGLLAYRILRQRATEAEEVPEAIIEYETPDLESEDVTASDLPLNGWLATAADLFDKGDNRLAMRALFLACLALLAEGGLISIARFKSNRDYMRELQRHAHALPGLMQAMTLNVRIFEGIWYGRHEASAEAMEAFSKNQERVFSIAGQ